MRWKRFIRDQTGEAYIDTSISIIIVVAVMAGLLSLLPIFTTYQALNSTARQIAHVVEVCGQADDATIALVTGRENYVKPDSIEFNTTWHNASTRKIQLKTPFTVTIYKNVMIPILRPITGDPIGINLTISANASGISEVYWKAGA